MAFKEDIIDEVLEWRAMAVHLKYKRCTCGQHRVTLRTAAQENLSGSKTGHKKLSDTGQHKLDAHRRY